MAVVRVPGCAAVKSIPVCHNSPFPYLSKSSMESTNPWNFEPAKDSEADARAPEPHSSTLRVGDLLCDRFRVVRFIARGGMGELYEAEDQAVLVAGAESRKSG